MLPYRQVPFRVKNYIPCSSKNVHLLFSSEKRWNRTLVREVLLEQGYPADLGLTKKIRRRLTNHEQNVLHAATAKKNLFVTGLKGSGKTSLLRHLGIELQQRGEKVMLCGITSDSAMQLGGITVASFLGTRNLDEKLRQEQVEGVLERHVRLMKTKHHSIYPTLMDVDVLLLDEVQLLPITVLQGLDAVARKLRDPIKVFGGLQIIVAGNFFELPFTKDMSHTGYSFQHPFWRSIFPFENQVALLPSHQDSYQRLALKTTFGTLNKIDVEKLESCGVRPPKKIPMSHFYDNVRAMEFSNPRFPRFTSQIETPRGLPKLRSTDIGWALADGVLQSARPATFSLPLKLNLEVGDPIEFVFGTVDKDISPGELAIVTKITDTSVTVRRPFRDDSLYVIHPMRVRIYHESYPDVHVEFSQFPINTRKITHTFGLKFARFRVPYVEIDCRLCTEVHSLGNILATLDRPILVPGTLDAYLKREGMIHEATVLHFERLFEIDNGNSDRWCKNCKNLIDSDNFERKHWAHCIQSSRWCSECDVSIPLALWDSHAERHTVVLCFDCGRQLQWRDWENHRRSCPGMLREISPDNLFIPSEVRSLSLSMGHNRRELHHNVHIAPRATRANKNVEIFT